MKIIINTNEAKPCFLNEFNGFIHLIFDSIIDSLLFYYIFQDPHPLLVFARPWKMDFAYSLDSISIILHPYIAQLSSHAYLY